MSNSFRVGSISAALNFQTAGFMQGVRDVVGASTGMRSSMKGVGVETAAATTAMVAGMKTAAAQAGVTSGAVGVLTGQFTAMTVAASSSVGAIIAKFVGLRSQAVMTARELDNMNRAAMVNRASLLNSDARIFSEAPKLNTGNEAAAMAALSTKYTGVAATAGKAALGIGAVAVAGALVARQLKPAIDASLQLEHSFAFVRKTVDGTKEQLDGISDSLREMALQVPIAVTELNGVAAAAGQLGIARDDIVDFTRIMAEMGIASDLTAEQAAVGFAQWSNITGMATEDIDNLTSAVVYLGNNTATTESQILNMTLRLAGASRIVGATDAEMAGLSASLASLGIWAESGGNAMSRIMFDMQKAVSEGSDELRLFASASGKTADQFAAHFKSAPMQAIVDFIGGLSAAEKAGMDVNSVLEALGVTEMESRRAILGLAGGHDKLAQNIKGSTQAFEDNNARAKEANTLFGTGVSKVELLKNATAELSAAVGDNLTSSYAGLITTLTSAVNWTSEMINKTNALQSTIAATTGMITGGIGRFFFGQATESGAERSIGNSYAINQEGFGKDKQDYMAKAMGLSYEDAAKSILNLQKTAKTATADVSGLNKELSSQKYKEGVLGLRNLVDSDVFKREAAEAIEIFKAVPDEITKEMRSAKFADMWKSSHDGFKSVGEAAKLIPEEFRQEFIASANVVETELAKKGKSGGKKLADEAGKEFERAMEEAMQFRIELFPEESLAEEVRKITKMAETFPEIMTGDAVAKAFDDLLVQFEDKGINAVEAIKTNIVGIAPEFGKAMEEAVERAKVASLEAIMEARSLADDESHWSKEGDFRQRGKDRFSGLTDPGGVATMIEDTRALTEHLNELVRTGEIGAESSESILSLDHWQNVKDLASMSFEDLTSLMQNFKEQGKEIPAILTEAVKSATFDKAIDTFKTVGDVATSTSAKLRDLGAKGLANVLEMVGKITSVGAGMAARIKEFPQLFKTFSDVATTAAIKVGTALHIALNVIALVADAIMVVTSLFGGMGDEGKKELKGMAAVIDEIKQASDAWIDSLTDKLVDAIKTGQFAWRDFVDEILTDLTRIAIRELVVSPAVNFAGGILGFADGGAFSKGHVVDSPEYFNTKSGPAVRGEAGTEVVMPAVRLSDGTLGVKSMGGGGSNVVVHVHDNRGANEPPVEVRQSTGPDGTTIINMVVNALKGKMIEGDFDSVLGAVQMRRGYR